LAVPTTTMHLVSRLVITAAFECCKTLSYDGNEIIIWQMLTVLTPNMTVYCATVELDTNAEIIRLRYLQVVEVK